MTTTHTEQELREKLTTLINRFDIYGGNGNHYGVEWNLDSQYAHDGSEVENLKGKIVEMLLPVVEAHNQAAVRDVLLRVRSHLSSQELFGEHEDIPEVRSTLTQNIDWLDKYSREILATITLPKDGTDE